MATGAESLQLDLFTSDPPTPAEGQLWYNTTDQVLRVRKASGTEDLGSGGGSGTALAVVQARRTSTAAITGTFAAVSFDTQDVSTASSVVSFAAPSTQIQVLSAGTYRVAYRFEIQNTSGTTQSCQARVRLNGTSTVAGTENHVSVYDGESDVLDADVVVTLAAGSLLTVEAVVITGTGTIQVGAIFLVQRADGTQGPTGSGSSVNVLEDGVQVAGTPHSALNFTGPLVTVTNAGGGQANVAVKYPASGEVSGTTTITTTSATDVLMTGMTLTPPAGTYLVWFTGDYISSSATTMVADIWVGGAVVLASERPSVASAATQKYCFAAQATVTVNGSQAIEGRWRRTAGTMTNTRRTLSYLRVA
jgi:hypothetical protein